MFSICARLAISGTTPRYLACSSAWLATALERTSNPSATTAAAVSSQVLSMPRMRVIAGVLSWDPASPESHSEEGKAEVGFEPTNNGFAIRPLSPLGYSAGSVEQYRSVAQRQCRLGFI